MNINLTLIGQSIAFLFFVWFCKAFVWTAIRKAMDEREQRISDGLEMADRARRELALSQKKATEQLHHAKQEAAVIIDLAHKRATQVVEQAKGIARTEAQRIKVGATAEMDRDVHRAKEQLRKQVAELIISGAEKVLEASIDQQANAKIIENTVARL